MLADPAGPLVDLMHVTYFAPASPAAQTAGLRARSGRNPYGASWESIGRAGHRLGVLLDSLQRECHKKGDSLSLRHEWPRRVLRSRHCRNLDIEICPIVFGQEAEIRNGAESASKQDG